VALPEYVDDGDRDTTGDLEGLKEGELLPDERSNAPPVSIAESEKENHL
jgi:hypothetical protein